MSGKSGEMSGNSGEMSEIWPLLVRRPSSTIELQSETPVTRSGGRYMSEHECDSEALLPPIPELRERLAKSHREVKLLRTLLKAACEAEQNRIDVARNLGKSAPVERGASR
jgi:hypothetical protein